MEFEVISTETIKPSSPTPPHLKTYKISILDQLIPAAPAALILYYHPHPNPPTPSPPQRTTLLPRLKPSLSQTLTKFYPLAGKMLDDLTVDCNDDGALFVEARARFRLSEFLARPDIGSLHRFLPEELPIWMEGSGRPRDGCYLAAAQATVFECGGTAVSVCASHKVIDAAALCSFFRAWAETARGCSAGVSPSFVTPSLFPQNPSLPKDHTLAPWVEFMEGKRGKSTIRRCVFDSAAITALKSLIISASNGALAPTRVEAVSAFLWKCTMSASKAAARGLPRPSVVAHAVNLRRRRAPPLPRHSFGNHVWMAHTTHNPSQSTHLHELASQIGKTVARIDGEFVRKFEGEEGSFKICDKVKELKEAFSRDAGYVVFTSLCNFGVYEVDFGWGNPVWASFAGGGGGGGEGVGSMNVVCLVDTKWGGGIEAWVVLEEDDMVVFERLPELLEFASLDPSPLALSYSHYSRL